MRAALLLILQVLTCRVTPLVGADSTRQLPIKISHEKGTFSGQLAVSLAGTMDRARAEWSATVANTSANKLFRVTFCIRAFDAADQQIRPGGNDCAISLWGSNWQPYTSLNFKGKQNIKIGDGKTAVEVSRFTIDATEVFDQTPNLREFGVRCSLVWPAAIRVFADRKFRPTVLDKDSLTATYAYDGGRVDSGSVNFLRSYTTAYTGWSIIWKSFRVDNASFYLRESKTSLCVGEVKMTFAGFGEPLFGNDGWYTVESNFAFEKALLDDVEAIAKKTASDDLDKAIGQLPPRSGGPKPVPTAGSPQLTITSNPTGAEIEINGEFIGNTPTTVSYREGKVTIKLSMAGRKSWERTLNLSGGDKRTVFAEMVPQ